MIAKTLNVPISSFFDNSATSADGPISGPMVTDLLITLYAVQMLKAFSRLPSDNLRRNIASLTESIAKSLVRPDRSRGTSGGFKSGPNEPPSYCSLGAGVALDVLRSSRTPNRSANCK